MKPLYVLVSLACMASAAEARPLLSDSQQSHVSACLKRSEVPERLVEVCAYGLSTVDSNVSDRIDLQLVLADSYYQLDNNAQASAIYEDILKADPDTIDALTGLGWIAHDALDMEAAQTYFERALAVRPSAEGLAGRASAMRHQGTISREDFETMLDAALALSPDYTWAAREKGWGLYRAFHDADAALDAAHAALAIDTDDVGSLYLLGFLLNELGRYGEAFAHLNRAAQLSESTSIYDQRSLASFGNANFKFALSDADRVIADWPDDPTGYVRRARALEALGQRRKAITELEEFLGRGHDDFAAYWLADLFFNDEKVQQSIAVLERIVHEGEPDFWTFQFLALVHLEEENVEEAREFAHAARNINAAEPYPYLYEAVILVAERDFEAAEAVMQTALDRGLPEQGVRWFLEELMGKGEYVRAIQLRVSYRDKGLLAD